jgi:hypothetical protein
LHADSLARGKGSLAIRDGVARTARKEFQQPA